MNDGICDCCDGSDEWDNTAVIKCSNKCKELAAEAKRVREQRLQDLEAALVVRDQYVEMAAKELPEKRRRHEELKARMGVEDGILEAIELKKKEAEAAWRVANDEKELRANRIREAEEAKKRQAEIEADRDEFDDAARELEREKQLQETTTEGGDASAAATTTTEATTTTTTTTAPEATTPPVTTEPVPPGPYADTPQDQLEEKVNVLQAAMDEAVKAYEAQLTVKNSLKSESEELDKLFSHDLNGGLTGDVMYGLWDKCFSKFIGEFNYNLCWMNKMEQSGTLMGMFTKFSKNADGDVVMHFEGGTRCWGADARSAMVTLKCAATNELVTVAEPNKCQYVAEFKTPAVCQSDALKQLRDESTKVEDETAEALEQEETNVIG